MVHMGGESWCHQRSLSSIPDLKTGHVDHLLFLSVFFYFSRTFYVDK